MLTAQNTEHTKKGRKQMSTATYGSNEGKT